MIEFSEAIRNPNAYTERVFSTLPLVEVDVELLRSLGISKDQCEWFEQHPVRDVAAEQNLAQYGLGMNLFPNRLRDIQNELPDINDVTDTQWRTRLAFHTYYDGFLTLDFMRRQAVVVWGPFKKTWEHVYVNRSFERFYLFCAIFLEVFEWRGDRTHTCEEEEECVKVLIDAVLATDESAISQTNELKFWGSLIEEMENGQL